jgi:hypothetical protein
LAATTEPELRDTPVAPAGLDIADPVTALDEHVPTNWAPGRDADTRAVEPTDTAVRAAPESRPPPPDSAAAVFWESVGIDPILVTVEDAEHYTLRCYLAGTPVFLGRAGRIVTLGSAEALAAHLGAAGADGHDLTVVSTWPKVLELAAAGELEVEVDPQNVYQLTGLGEDLADGPEAVDPSQLDLGVELLLDLGEWAGDESAEIALRPSQSLGWLTSFVLRPDPTRLAPSPPFEAEAARWNQLVGELLRRFRRP